MRRPVSIASMAVCLLTLAAPGSASEKKKTPRLDKPQEITSSVFSGSESRLKLFGWFGPDCKGPLPDVRVATKPAKGTIRFEEITATLLESSNPMRKKCAGKPVSQIALYYRAPEDASGRDKIVLDADTKFGHIVRFIISVDIKAGSHAAVSAAPAQGVPAQHFSRSVLAGNETRIAAPNYLNADCTSGPLPDLRVVAAPKNGAYRTEETSMPAERPAGDTRAGCNGKPVNAVAVFYKPAAAFTGADAMTIDVDFHNGTVRRYVYDITVR